MCGHVRAQALREREHVGADGLAVLHTPLAGYFGRFGLPRAGLKRSKPKRRHLLQLLQVNVDCLEVLHRLHRHRAFETLATTHEEPGGDCQVNKTVVHRWVTSVYEVNYLA